MKYLDIFTYVLTSNIWTSNLLYLYIKYLDIQLTVFALIIRISYSLYFVKYLVIQLNVFTLNIWTSNLMYLQ